MARINKNRVAAGFGIVAVALYVWLLYWILFVYGPGPVEVVEVKSSKSVACYLNESLISSFTDMDRIYISPQGGTLYLELGERRAVYRLRSGEVCATDDGKIHKGEQPLAESEEDNQE